MPQLTRHTPDYVKKFEKHNEHHSSKNPPDCRKPDPRYMKITETADGGFSIQAVQALAACGERLLYVDIPESGPFVRNC